MEIYVHFRGKTMQATFYWLNPCIMSNLATMKNSSRFVDPNLLF